MDFDPNTVRLIKRLKRHDKKGPRPEDFGNHLPIDEDSIVQIPLELPLEEPYLEEKPKEKKEEEPSNRGIVVINISGEEDE